MEIIQRIKPEDVKLDNSKVKPLSKFRLAVNEYKQALQSTPDGGAVIFKAEYLERQKVRRRLHRAADELGYKITLRKYYRGGEYVVVNKNDQEEPESIHA